MGSEMVQVQKRKFALSIFEKICDAKKKIAETNDEIKNLTKINQQKPFTQSLTPKKLYIRKKSHFYSEQKDKPVSRRDGIFSDR